MPMHWFLLERLNMHSMSEDNSGALDTYGLALGYSITPDLKASLGYYYQQADFGSETSQYQSPR